MKWYEKNDVVAELVKRFPEADPGPAGLWGFVNAGWEGPVDDNDLDNWAEAWKDAEQDWAEAWKGTGGG
jgi:hypothetical protein